MREYFNYIGTLFLFLSDCITNEQNISFCWFLSLNSFLHKVTFRKCSIFGITKKRWSHNHLIFITEIPTLGKKGLYVEMGTISILSFSARITARIMSRDHFVYASSQWEMMFHCNAISHWLGAFTKWSLMSMRHYPTALDLVVQKCFVLT